MRLFVSVNLPADMLLADRVRASPHGCRFQIEEVMEAHTLLHIGKAVFSGARAHEIATDICEGLQVPAAEALRVARRRYHLWVDVDSARGAAAAACVRASPLRYLFLISETRSGSPALKDYLKETSFTRDKVYTKLEKILNYGAVKAALPPLSCLVLQDLLHNHSARTFTVQLGVQEHDTLQRLKALPETWRARVTILFVDAAPSAEPESLSAKEVVNVLMLASEQCYD